MIFNPLKFDIMKFKLFLTDRDGEANFWVNLNNEDLGIFDTYDEARACFEEEKAKEIKARAEGAEPRAISFGWIFEYIEEI